MECPRPIPPSRPPRPCIDEGHPLRLLMAACWAWAGLRAGRITLVSTQGSPQPALGPIPTAEGVCSLVNAALHHRHRWLLKGLPRTTATGPALGCLPAPCWKVTT